MNANSKLHATLKAARLNYGVAKAGFCSVSAMKANLSSVSAKFFRSTKVKFSFALAVSLCAFVPLVAQDLSDDYKQGVMYYSKFRGGVTLDMYIAKSDIVALQKNGVLPNGATIVVEEYFNENGKKGALNRYIAMQKRGKAWKFIPYNADKSVNLNDNPARCSECHISSINGEDKVFSLDKIKAYKLK